MAPRDEAQTQVRRMTRCPSGKEVSVGEASVRQKAWLGVGTPRRSKLLVRGDGKVGAGLCIFKGHVEARGLCSEGHGEPLMDPECKEPRLYLYFKNVSPKIRGQKDCSDKTEASRLERIPNERCRWCVIRGEKRGGAGFQSSLGGTVSETQQQLCPQQEGGNAAPWHELSKQLKSSVQTLLHLTKQNKNSK